jgi:hypothetical protein
MIGGLVAGGLLAASAVVSWMLGPEGDAHAHRGPDHGAFAWSVEPGRAWAAYTLSF